MIEEALLRWAIQTRSALEDSLTLFRPFFQHETKLDRRLEYTLFRLSTSCFQTSDSTVLLVSQQRLWDADILARSVLEGTYKFAFLCSTDEQEREQRLVEYLEKIPEAGRIKRHDRATRLLGLHPEMDEYEKRHLTDLCVDDSELTSLRDRNPRKSRKLLDDKWSFIPIAEQLAKEMPGFEVVVGTIFSFGMTSHLVHKDGDALFLEWDREKRDDDRRQALELAHGARLLSDMIDLQIFRAFSSHRLKQIDRATIQDFEERHASLRSELRAAHLDWAAQEYGQVADPHQNCEESQGASSG